jgi:hypothetical protein
MKFTSGCIAAIKNWNYSHDCNVINGKFNSFTAAVDETRLTLQYADYVAKATACLMKANGGTLAYRGSQLFEAHMATIIVH